jgi:hypothetical protein
MAKALTPPVSDPDAPDPSAPDPDTPVTAADFRTVVLALVRRRGLFEVHRRPLSCNLHYNWCAIVMNELPARVPKDELLRGSRWTSEAASQVR